MWTENLSNQWAVRYSLPYQRNLLLPSAYGTSEGARTPFKPEQALNATYPDMNLRLLRYKGALGEFHGA